MQYDSKFIPQVHDLSLLPIPSLVLNSVHVNLDRDSQSLTFPTRPRKTHFGYSTPRAAPLPHFRPDIVIPPSRSLHVISLAVPRCGSIFYDVKNALSSWQDQIE